MSTAPKSEVLQMAALAEYQEGAVVSRQITKAEAGNVTLFAFDAGQELSEHTAPFDALVHVLDGEVEVKISGQPLPSLRIAGSFGKRFQPVIQGMPAAECEEPSGIGSRQGILSEQLGRIEKLAHIQCSLIRMDVLGVRGETNCGKVPLAPQEPRPQFHGPLEVHAIGAIGGQISRGCATDQYGF